MSQITVDAIELHALEMPLVGDFATSFGRVRSREMLIVEVRTRGGLTGWGEAPVASRPHYSAETRKTALHVLEDWLAPALVGQSFGSLPEVMARIGFCRGHRMAKASAEWAFADLFAQVAETSLAVFLGQVRDRVSVGISLGIPGGDDPCAALVDQVAARVEEGYRRIKIKVKPGFCVSPVRVLRERFPDLLLVADANGSFALSDAEELAKLDPYGLQYLEQPIAPYDLVDHARLRKLVRTPICLDESIEGPEDLASAIELGAIDILNIKPGRMGGPTNALKAAATCARLGIPAWCGGMLETGIGRAACVALASTAGFVLEADLSASSRYYAEDLVEPAFTLNQDSTLTVPTGIGLGVAVQRDRLTAATTHRVTVTG